MKGKASCLMVFLITAQFLALLLFTPNFFLVISEVNGEGVEIHILNDTTIQERPSIYGDKMVWQEMLSEGGAINWEVFLYDLSIDTDGDETPNYLENESTGGRPHPDPAKYRITYHASWQVFPQIYENLIVWEDWRDPGNFDIYLYDLSVDSDNDTIPNYMDDDDDEDGTPDVDDPDPDPAEIQITDNPAHQEKPAIYGTKIVWSDKRWGDQDIYIYDLITQKEVCLTPTTEEGGGTKYAPLRYNARIYGDKVTWETVYGIGGQSDIFMYNLSLDTDNDGVPNWLDDDRPEEDPAEINVIDHPYEDKHNAIYGNFITFDRMKNVYVYDLYEDAEYKLTNNTDWRIDKDISIHGNKIVWGFDINGLDSIFMYDLGIDSDDDGIPNYKDEDDDKDGTPDLEDPDPDPALIRITDENKNQESPDIFANKIVWQDYRKSHTDIYMHLLTSNYPPEIIYANPKGNLTLNVSEYTVFNISASDPDGDSLVYKWFDNDILIVGGNSDEYNLSAAPGSEGHHEIKVIVTDGEYPDEQLWHVHIINQTKPGNGEQNQPPDIESIFPTQLNPTIPESSEQTFSVSVSDPDSSELNYTWYLNGTKITGENTSEYIYNSRFDYNGSDYSELYNITIGVSDGEFTVYQTWNLTVNFLEDSDGDGYNDSLEFLYDGDPFNAGATPPDMDADGEPDAIDDDIDGDGVPNDKDAYPLDPNRTKREKDEDEELLYIVVLVIIVIIIVVEIILITRSAKGKKGEPSKISSEENEDEWEEEEEEKEEEE